MTARHLFYFFFEHVLRTTDHLHRPSPDCLASPSPGNQHFCLERDSYINDMIHSAPISGWAGDGHIVD